MPKECHPTPSRTAYTHRQQAICSWCLYLHKEHNCKQLGNTLWKTSGSEQLCMLHSPGKKNMAIDQDGDRDGQPSKKRSKEGPRFVKQILLNNPEGVRGTPFPPLNQVPALRAAGKAFWAAAPSTRPWEQHIASWAAQWVCRASVVQTAVIYLSLSCNINNLSGAWQAPTCTVI